MLLTEKTSEIKHTQLTPDGDSFRMRVPVLQADAPPNLNKRTYPFAVVKAAVEALKAKLQTRSAFGSTRHEKDLEIDAVSHTIEDIELDDKGEASAVLRILGTQRGKNLAAIIRGGGSLGVSARGFGDVDEKGAVKAGYRIAGVDFTLDPSFNFRVGKECVMFESRSEEEEIDGSVSLEELEKMGLVDEGGIKEQDPEKIVRLKYSMALQSGYQGSESEFRATFNRTAADREAEIKFSAAREAGYRGDLESFKKGLK